MFDGYDFDKHRKITSKKELSEDQKSTQSN